ncbi:MAG: hypothetical protein JWL95_2708 [Gemmatimonadetes bacterium]|nr:hypothetical protein [Gemmatimonadota bacterium]
MKVRMSTHLGVAVSLSVALAGAACTHETNAPPESAPPDQDGSSTTVQQPAVIDPTCSSRGGEREDIPRGQCVDGAECRFATPAGVHACKPGMKAIAAIPNQWLCTCSTAEWTCEITAGGLGLVPCPDVGDGDSGVH